MNADIPDMLVLAHAAFVNLDPRFISICCVDVWRSYANHVGVFSGVAIKWDFGLKPGVMSSSSL